MVEILTACSICKGCGVVQ